jgi:hypothetical protein
MNRPGPAPPISPFAKLLGILLYVLVLVTMLLVITGAGWTIQYLVKSALRT